MKVDLSFLKELGIARKNYGASYGKWIKNDSAPLLKSISPINGELIAEIHQAGPDDYELVIEKAQEAFKIW